MDHFPSVVRFYEQEGNLIVHNNQVLAEFQVKIGVKCHIGHVAVHGYLEIFRVKLHNFRHGTEHAALVGFIMGAV